ncbi:MAG: hypothetical protein V3S55_15530 [Nitrospiraceae bacterium]
MNMTIKFQVATDSEGAYRAADRIGGLLLEQNEKWTILDGGYIAITLPAIRASEFCAELVREGFVD